jgi:hypothetical protein
MIASAKLDGNFVSSRQDFLTVHISHLCEYQEQTVNHPDTQLVEAQILSYLPEAVSNDAELNRLWHWEILRISDVKNAMELTRYIKALGDLAVLADQSTPRKTAKSLDGYQRNHSTHLLQIGSGSDSNSNSDDDGDPINKTTLAYLVHKMVKSNQIKSNLIDYFMLAKY